MLHRDGIVRAAGSDTPATTESTFSPKVKSVIWLFMVGGASHVESFDPKPALSKYGGKTIGETPFKYALESPFVKENLREFAAGTRRLLSKLYPLQIEFRKHGQSGIEISDWWPNVAACVDDLAIVRSMWTTDNDHGAQLQFHTGRHVLEGNFPTIGSWVHYGFGSLNDNLPQFVVLGGQLADCCGGIGGHGADYLGPEHTGVPLVVDPIDPLPFARPDGGAFQEEQASKWALLGRLNRLASVAYPDDAALRARIKSYELAFRMQTSVPQVLRFEEESEATRRLYGLDHPTTQPFGRLCLTARRLVERGVRFVQVYHGANSGAGDWDAHHNLRDNHARQCAQVDRPIAGLIRDLKQRGLLSETLVVWATEFGRTPGAEGDSGRDHHPFGFSVWLAGGGIKGGVVHGATDEIGFHAVEHRHYVTDIHATILHQLGLDARQLEIPGRKRLEIDFGRPIYEILSQPGGRQT
jgi:hypothetical protein